jgi:hypothetical protein
VPEWIARLIAEGHEPTVLRSAAGYYIGAWDAGPLARYSEEYWGDVIAAKCALEAESWTPRANP